MNILIVSQNYYPEVGAAPSRLANMAAGLQQSGAKVSVLTALPNYPKGRIFEGYRGCISRKERHNEIDIFRYWTYASVSKKAIPRAINMFALAITIWLFAFKFKRIRSFDKVIIQSPSLPIACSAMIIFKMLYRREVILNVSDLWPLTGVELGAMKSGGMSYKFMESMERFLYSHADLIQGQSQEIIDYIKALHPNKEFFLYRNLQPKIEVRSDSRPERAPLKIVFAGLLGVAQDMLSLIKAIDFKAIGAELHIYGGGNQAVEIEEWIEGKDLNVFYHGYIDKCKIADTLSQYHASIIPLTVRIQGAVPSKIFDMISIGTPILYSGGGEGADIVERYGVGFVSEPSDFGALQANIVKMKDLSDREYAQIISNSLSASQTDFSFEDQIKRYYNLLKRQN